MTADIPRTEGLKNWGKWHIHKEAVHVQALQAEHRPKRYVFRRTPGDTTEREADSYLSKRKSNLNGMIVKAIAIWVLIAAGEILNGNVRVRFLHRRYGINRAKKISFFTGITIIYSICWFSLPWVNPSNLQDCFLVGIIWTLLMLCVDIYFGRYVFRFKWIKILEDFDLRKGNLLGVGMGLLLFCPTIVYLLI